ncbi:DUF599 family protein, partial [Celeribacter marinus]|uniref:DUF599 family protein n=1 Tax=Celeribacter marinus TaxID=1397108 RepID=UPI003F6C28DC
MELIDQLQFFSALDAVAVSFLLIAWLGIGRIIENPPVKHRSTSYLMADYRRKWMIQMITRQPRIFDAAILDSLRQSTAFFGSACLIAIGGGLATL